MVADFGKLMSVEENNDVMIEKYIIIHKRLKIYSNDDSNTSCVNIVASETLLQFKQGGKGPTTNSSHKSVSQTLNVY